ncbi:MAG: YggT family protein [Clostridia bacterium]|nr:YggT family protein [Clostridia bacterium]
MPILRIIAWILVPTISAYQLIMFARAICSWFPPVRETKFYRFLYIITEPLISPIRELLHKISWIRMLPIDLSFLVLYLLLDVVAVILSIFM